LNHAEALEGAGLREWAMSRENVEVVKDLFRRLQGPQRRVGATASRRFEVSLRLN
jgi:hypothetical protein